MKRDPYFDNARLLLILLVVVGHIINDVALSGPDHPARPLLYLIYFFHMPAMATISGFFAKAVPACRGAGKLAVRLLVPYALFQGAYMLTFSVDGISLATPFYLTWYLVSLFSWQLVLTIAIRVRYGVAWAFALGLLAGYVPQVGHFLSLSRTLAFFPFFLLGYHLERRHFEQLVTWRLPALLVLTGLALAAVVVAPRSNPLWLNFADAYTTLNHPGVGVALLRLFQYGAAVLGSGAFFALVPTGQTWFTPMGTRTMYVYLWHGIVILLLVQAGLHVWSPNWIVTAFLGIVIGLGLATPAVKRVTTKVVEPLWLLEPTPTISEHRSTA